MSTLHLIRPRSASRLSRLPRAGSLHRWWLRLRSRWLGWRGQATLQAVSGTAVVAGGGVSLQERRRYQQELVELNLLLERARAGQDAQGKPGGMAR